MGPFSSDLSVRATQELCFESVTEQNDNDEQKGVLKVVEGSFSAVSRWDNDSKNASLQACLSL